ncbi:helix-turn-helix domain-containing protein [Paenibacillus taiwanensis]|uniref:helix-turn-helix domain-containing protein n=1 Tax=Paenibacillus taiwanensis TaxID=401638 RepID=UPI000409231E|nr:helix-turn-helix transcriptional regulator [Paenibacillus taiwanensis]
METLGRRIKKIRKLNEMNQIDFSSRVGISQATLSEVEQDKYKPSVEIIISIASIFHVDLAWLVLGTASSNNKVIGVNEVNEKEADLLLLFDKLKANDQDEIIAFIKMKLSRY